MSGAYVHLVKYKLLTYLHKSFVIMCPTILYSSYLPLLVGCLVHQERAGLESLVPVVVFVVVAFAGLSLLTSVSVVVQ